MFPTLHFVIASLFFFFVSVYAEAMFAGDSVVILRSQDLHAYNLAIDGFVNECKRSNIDIESIEDMAGKLENGRKIIKRFAVDDKKPDLFLAVGVLAATLAKKSIKDVPVIFCMVVNYHRFNLEAPNIRGIASEISEKVSIAIYKETVGHLKNIGVIYDPSKTANIIANGRECFDDIGLKLISVSVTSGGAVEKALKSIIGRIDAVWLVPDSTVISRKTFSYIYATTLKKRIPILCTSDIFVKGGALIGVYPNYKNIGVEAGKMAYEVLKKGDLGSANVRYPEQFDIAVNLETASRIKLKIADDFYKKYNVIKFP
ncbi:MAG: ABC transporter substrate-binding protein [Candidatus Anammoxibacter sp.]